MTEPSNKEAVAIWIPSDGIRGHVVYMGMPVYFFQPAEAQEMISKVMTDLFGEETRR